MSRNIILSMKHIGIIGYGLEGRFLHRFLKKQYPKARIEILDRKNGPDYLAHLERFDILYRSPGVPYLTPELQRAIKKGVYVSSATKLFFEKAPGTIIGVTGTKGKGTTSTLIYKILKAAKKDVHLAGNIGKPAVAILPRLKKSSISILELSSFQLHDCTVSPHIAVVLDISPDHLDSHKTFKEYVSAKANIVRSQKEKDIVLYNPGNKEAKSIALKSEGRKISTSFKNNAVLLEKIRNISRLPGEHNLRNALIAALTAREMGIDESVILRAIKKYRGLPYRLEHVATIGHIRAYNDSASTNPVTAAAAVRAFEGPVALIAGGKDKNFGYEPLAEALREKKGVTVILFGENKKKIEMTVKGTAPVRMATDLKDAFKKALTSLPHKGAIIFSPGAASFDMFANYKDRGAQFTAIAKDAENKYTG